MIFLLLTTLCSALLILLFKVFERNAVPVFQAIVFNYWTAAICGFIFLPDRSQLFNPSTGIYNWLPLSIFLGMLFINTFNLTSITTLKFGVSTASVASKLGLVFPVMLAFVLYHERFDWIKGVGILFAFVAVILSSLKDDGHQKHQHSKLLLVVPYLVFFGNGACDSLTQLANKRYLMERGISEFSAILFLSAAVTGTLFLTWQLATGRTKLVWKSVIGGIALGIPNYLAFIFMLKALATVSWGSSVVFPVANLGTVAVATIVSLILFREKISKINLLGLGFACVSIVLIIFSNYR